MPPARDEDQSHRTDFHFAFVCVSMAHAVFQKKRLENHSEKHLNYLRISAAPGTERGSNFPNRRQPHYYFSLTEGEEEKKCTLGF